MAVPDGLLYSRVIYDDFHLFLGECDLHGCRRRDLEPLESILSDCRLRLILKFNKGNIMTTRYESNFLETLESATQKLKCRYEFSDCYIHDKCQNEKRAQTKDHK